uniref:Ubiquitin-like protease family profile domain-containing protein n=1 Tax=Graphocephala atropunctata TaxID=36148 RepID=A0A1B6KCX7_9HEMI
MNNVDSKLNSELKEIEPCLNTLSKKYDDSKIFDEKNIPNEIEGDKCGSILEVECNIAGELCLEEKNVAPYIFTPDFAASTEVIVESNGNSVKNSPLTCKHVGQERPDAANNVIVYPETTLANSCVTVNFVETLDKKTYSENQETEKSVIKTSRKFVKCHHLIGDFSIDSQTWSAMKDSKERLLTTVYPSIVSQKFFPISKGCVLQMKNINYFKKSGRKILTVYAYCGHNTITTFKLEFYKIFNSKDVLIRVFSNANSCLHEQKKTRELSGILRDKIKHTLLTRNPMSVRLDCVQNLDVEGVQLNNVQEAKSYSVFRKARSEALAANDLDKNALIDLMKMAIIQSGKQDQYVQLVGNPLHVIIFSKQLLDLTMKAKNVNKKTKNELTMHLDATGTVVRYVPPGCDSKRVLYYALVFRLSHYVLPASEYITCSHTGASIGFWLLAYKQFLVNNRQWPICNRVVTDFSWAIINAVLTQWNCMSMVTYLLACHEFINAERTKYLPTVTLHICVSHFVKIIVKDIYHSTFTQNNSEKKNIKEFVMQVMCSIINCCCYDTVKLILRHALVVLLSKNMSSTVSDSVKILVTVCGPLLNVNVKEEDTTFRDEVTEEDDSPSDALYKRSPFYKDIKSIETDIITLLKSSECSQQQGCTKDGINGTGILYDSDEVLIDNDGSSFCDVFNVVTENKHYCPRMAHLIVTKYSPYLPMWSALLLKSSSGNVTSGRLSNGPVENWFFQLKNIILAGEKRLRPNRFVRRVRQHLMGIYREIILNIPREGCARGKRKLKVNTKEIRCKKKMKSSGKSTLKSPEDSDLIVNNKNIDTIEESWDKRGKIPKTFFNSQYIQRIGQEKVGISDSEANVIRNKVLPSGLVDDVDYYVPVKNGLNYVVCILKGPIVGQLYVNFDDMKILITKQWFTSDNITAISFMLQKAYPDTNSIVFDDNVATAALYKGENIDSEHFLLKNSKISQQTTKLFFPVNINQSHWVLVYVKIKEKQFSYIDPMYDLTQCNSPHIKAMTTRTFDNLLVFLSSQTNEHIEDLKEGWTVVQHDHPVQKDAYNCGVFVMYFMEQLMNNDKIALTFAPDKHRIDLYRELLMHSENMSHVCLPCGRSFTTFIPLDKECESVECSACLRWFHIIKPGCLPDDVPKDIDELNKPDIKVFCTLCRLYWKNHLQQ